MTGKKKLVPPSGAVAGGVNVGAVFPDAGISSISAKKSITLVRVEKSLRAVLSCDKLTGRQSAS